MKKIVFGITSLATGGAERVLVDLVNRLANEYDITIFTIYNNGLLEAELNNNIKRVSLYDKKYTDLNAIEKIKIKVMFSSLIIMRSIYNKYILNKYDTEVAFLEGPITNLFAFSSHANKVAWVHTDISQHIKNKIRQKQYRNAYLKYNKIVFVSNNTLDGYNKVFKNRVTKEVINNYLNIDRVKQLGQAFQTNELSPTDYNFLMVGRLVKSKGIIRLADVSKKLMERGYSHHIYIIGDGPEKDNINKKIKKLKLEDSFILLGSKENPYPYIKNCNCFILPSLYEGYGMVLLEAMVFNKPIIITTTGAQEAVNNYPAKLIAQNDADDLYETMKRILTKDVVFNDVNSFNLNFEDIIAQIKDIL